MSCRICKRYSCTESFHSLEEQELFEQREQMPDDVDLLRRMVQEGAADVISLKKEIEAQELVLSLMPEIDTQGISFGNAWLSFDKMTGCMADSDSDREVFYKSGIAKELLAWANSVRQAKADLP